MRCALVALDFGQGLTGVDKAMAGQARAAAESGTPLDIIVVNATGESRPNRDGVRHLAYSARLAKLGRLSRLMKARLIASVAELDRYDVVFLRYPTAIDVDPLYFVRRAHARVVTVHHAKQVSEQLAVSRSPGNLARAALEFVQVRRLLRCVDGVVGVTDEIRDYHVARSGRALPSCTVANGVDVARIPSTGFAPLAARGELRLALMSSSHAVWHGTDRLLEALRGYRGARPVAVDMIGQSAGAPGTEEQIGNATIRHHGMLHGPALDAVLAKATLGISTLAFFRTGLRQAAVLKTREYIARGLPVVFGYDDVDVPDDAPFVLRVPNDDSPLSIDQLFEFAERTAAMKDLSATMRAFAEATLDWRVKVPRFTQFAEEILSSSLRPNEL